MNLPHLFRKNPNGRHNTFFDNSSRIGRSLYRVRSYREIFRRARKKSIATTDLLRSLFPFAFRDAEEPPIVAVELTNYCNLKCPYCTNYLGERKRGFMNEAVFERMLNDLHAMRPRRIQLVGLGESTLHPRFGEYIKRLSQTGGFVSMVTNGQWEKPEVITQILSALDLVEISIDAGGKEKYEASRINGSFDHLLANLDKLNAERKRLGSQTLINIRVMLRPSQRGQFQKEYEFWKNYADRVMPQYIVKINNTTYSDDVHIPTQSRHGEFPRCSMPFKHLEVKFTGEVLMCYYTIYQVGIPGLVIGNVLDSSIKELWNSEVMQKYRNAHRGRQTENMPVCKGCPGT